MSGKDEWHEDQAAVLRQRIEGLDAVEICPWLSATADIAAEVHSSTGIAITKKLNKQLARAKSAGYRVGLLIDQMGAEDLRYGANFMPSSSTVRSVVEALESEASWQLDGLAIVEPDGMVNRLRWPDV